MVSVGRAVASTVAAGLALLILSFVVSGIFGFIFTDYNVLELDGMRSTDDPLMIFYFIHPFFAALVYSVGFYLIKSSFSGSTVMKGIRFGLFLFLVVTLPSQFLVFSSMDYPPAFYVINLATSIIALPVAGIIIAKIIK
ncbi:MAG: hypothetical protein J4224_03205 [Candidatus Diapherotrites archaeon]|uniref:Uncharacterized protein n=1 Tax=Candidatus Iainarchaeum sp. TaxID=3101447 RepID=A0A7J4IVJ3_9ARCH|nr:MAG: hypothetical protein QT03_C0001G0421 [archaeon GW2011_AR10]MBS3059406.1 hypothetical protein [Candidatus Diapherotrites archaeon]HIH08830.1 hypothetical protein [Candidatus Diapherotrites archaeon]